MKPGGQRAKGRAFEQWVAQRYRAKWPHLTVRRSLQAHQAFEPDVVIEGEGAPLLWTECHHGSINPLKKYEQALRDMARLDLIKTHLAIVVFKRTGQRRASVLAPAYAVLPKRAGDPASERTAAWADRIPVFDFEGWLELL